MSCFKKNIVIRSDYISGSGNYLRLFFRKTGTVVHHCNDEHYVARKDTLIIQWAGSLEYDSGYPTKYYPATMSGLKTAHADMNNYEI